MFQWMHLHIVHLLFYEQLMDISHFMCHPQVPWHVHWLPLCLCWSVYAYSQLQSEAHLLGILLNSNMIFTSLHSYDDLILAILRHPIYFSTEPARVYAYNPPELAVWGL